MDSNSDDVPDAFTPEEDMAMWRFAMEHHPGYDRHELWKLFVEKTGSKCDPAAFHDRFWNHLIPHLKEIKLHTETKLKMCIQHKIPLGDDFLYFLRKEAQLTLTPEGLVKGYTMKLSARPNLDRELDDEGFLEAMKIAELTHFTEDEEQAMWKYAMRIQKGLNCKEGKKEEMWKRFKEETESEHTEEQLCSRFYNHLLPCLRHTDFPTEQKLSLCRFYQPIIDDNFLKELRNEAYVTLKDGKVEQFRMKAAYDMVLLPGLRGRRYSPKEEEEMWNYVIENFEKGGRWRVVFWRNFAMKTKRRTAEAYADRFSKIKWDLGKRDMRDMDIKKKMKLYEWCGVEVEAKDWKAYEKASGDSGDSGAQKTEENMISGSEEGQKTLKLEDEDLLTSAVTSVKLEFMDLGIKDDQTASEDEDVAEPMDLDLGSDDDIQVISSDEVPEDVHVPEEQYGTLAEALDRIVNNSASYHESYDPMILENVSTGDVEKSMIELQGIGNEDLDENYNPFRNIF